jgi:hypothetical protein
VKIAEFFVELLVDSSAGKMAVGDLISGMGALEVATLGEIGALIALATKIAMVADEAMWTAVAFQAFEVQTGLSSQALQRWQIAGQQVNVTAEAIASSVLGLQRNLAAIRLGGGNIAPFQILGIGANQDAFAVLEQLRERLRNVNPATATNIVSQMGIDPSMLNILRLSNAEFATFMATARGQTGSQTTSMLNLKLALTTLQLTLKDLGLMMLDFFGPQFQLFADFVYLINQAVRGVRALAGEFGGLAHIFKYMMLLNPFGLLFLAIDDLITYFRGGNSLTGLAVEGFKKMFAAIEEGVKTLMPHLPDLERVASLALKSASAAALWAPIAVPALGGQLAAAATNSVMNNKVEIGINSSAPADEVARQSAEAFRRILRDASLQTDNGER